MECVKGYLVAEDEKTHHMMPFFVKVRTEDIVSTNAVNINKVLTKTSERWDVVDVYDDTEKTIYQFRQSFSGTPVDPNAEVLYSTFLHADVTYVLHKYGKLEIYGVVRCNGNANPDFGLERLAVDKNILLPYAFELGPVPDGRSKVLNANCNFGTIAQCSFTASINGTRIHNLHLNPELKDENEYLAMLRLEQITPNPKSEFKDLDFVRQTHEPGAYQTVKYSDYLVNYLPIYFSYQGFWNVKSEEEETPLAPETPEIVFPETPEEPVEDTVNYQAGYQAGYNQGVLDAKDAVDPTSANYQGGYEAGHTSGYTLGHDEGVEEADNRSNPESVNYQSGYSAGYDRGVEDADGRENIESANYQAGYITGHDEGVVEADGRINTESVNYKGGYSAGTSDADARSMPGTVNYQSGYDAGVAYANTVVDATSASYTAGYQNGYNVGYEKGLGSTLEEEIEEKN